MRRFLVAVLALCLCLAPLATGQSLLEIIEAKEEAVRSLEQEMRQLWARGRRCGSTAECGCSIAACVSGIDDADATCAYEDTVELDECYCGGVQFTEEDSAVRIASDNVRSVSDADVIEVICASQSLDFQFKQNALTDDKMEWQGFGSWNGVFRIYPGRSQATCDSFDPRTRAWYVAASSGPKDVVVIIDKSGSMLDNNRLEIAKEASISVVNALTINDFFAVVAFSSSATVLSGSSNNLVRGTKENKDAVIAAINALSPGGPTTMFDAFALAYDLLEDSHGDLATSSGCSKAVVFLTDGEITPRGTESPAQAKADLVELLNQKSDEFAIADIPIPRPFLFSLGANADREFMKQLGCSDAAGLWQHVDDGGNLKSAMSSYYEYFAIGVAAAIEHDSSGPTQALPVSWVEPFNFATGGVLGTSASVPVYTYDTPVPIFVGVIGTGFSMEEINAVESNPATVLEELISRGQGCSLFVLDNDQVEALRTRTAGDTCGAWTDDGEERLNPLPCDDEIYPSGVSLWCNTDRDSEEHSENACCMEGGDVCVGSSPSAVGLVVGLVFASIVFIIICCCLCYCLRGTCTSSKTTTGSSVVPGGPAARPAVRTTTPATRSTRSTRSASNASSPPASASSNDPSPPPYRARAPTVSSASINGSSSVSSCSSDDSSGAAPPPYNSAIRL